MWMASRRRPVAISRSLAGRTHLQHHARDLGAGRKLFDPKHLHASSLLADDDRLSNRKGRGISPRPSNSPSTPPSSGPNDTAQSQSDLRQQLAGCGNRQGGWVSGTGNKDNQRKNKHYNNAQTNNAKQSVRAQNTIRSHDLPICQKQCPGRTVSGRGHPVSLVKTAELTPVR